MGKLLHEEKIRFRIASLKEACGCVVLGLCSCVEKYYIPLLH